MAIILYRLASQGFFIIPLLISSLILASTTLTISSWSMNWPLDFSISSHSEDSLWKMRMGLMKNGFSPSLSLFLASFSS